MMFLTFPRFCLRLVLALGLAVTSVAHAAEVMPADLQKLSEQRKLHNAVLFNNAGDRLVDPKTKHMAGDLAGLGRPVDPQPVMIIAEARVPREMVNLYTSIKRLPEGADAVRIFYTLSEDWTKATLLGLLVEKPRGTDVAFYRYDGVTPWLKWATDSLAKLEAETVKPK